MKYIVSFSGGVGSAMSAELAIKEYGKQNVILLFADTLIEDETLYTFNEQVSAYLGLAITSISEGRTPWQVFEDEKFIGNSRIDPCSKILKRNLLKKWIQSKFKSTEVEVIMGIDCTEEHRLQRVVSANRPYLYRSMLIEQDIFVFPQTKLDWIKNRGLSLPRLYELGFAHDNCGGFCVKAGLGQFKLLFEKLPERYRYHEDKEQQAINNNPNLRPFLKKMIKGKTIYLTMKEYRVQFLEKNKITEAEKLDFGGCGCAL